MKRILTIVLLCSLLAGLAATESKLRFGFLAPKDAKTSFIGGFTYGSRIDEAVGLETSADFFYKSYTEKRKVASGTTPGGTDFITVQKSTDINLIYVPLMANLNVYLPIRSAVNPYVSGGIGWGLLWEDVFIAAYENDDNETVPAYDNVKFYNGFTWNIAAGVSYKLGSKSNVFGEVFYHGSKMKRDFDQTEYGITWDEVDMSGIGMRLGVEFSYNLR